MYAGGGEASLLHFRQTLAQLSRSFILRMRLHRSVANWLLGKLILSSLASEGASAARALREVTRVARTLWRENVDFSRVFSLLLTAAVAHRRGRTALCTRTLRDAAVAAERADLPQCAAAARWRLAGLQRNAKEMAEAERWFGEQRIRNPTRMLDVWAPGFTHSA